MALHISRQIDLPPESELQASLRETQRAMTQCLTAIEIIANKRETDPLPQEDAKEDSKEPKAVGESELLQNGEGAPKDDSAQAEDQPKVEGGEELDPTEEERKAKEE